MARLEGRDPMAFVQQEPERQMPFEAGQQRHVRLFERVHHPIGFGTFAAGAVHRGFRFHPGPVEAVGRGEDLRQGFRAAGVEDEPDVVSGREQFLGEIERPEIGRQAGPVQPEQMTMPILCMAKASAVSDIHNTDPVMPEAHRREFCERPSGPARQSFAQTFVQKRQIPPERRDRGLGCGGRI